MLKRCLAEPPNCCSHGLLAQHECLPQLLQLRAAMGHEILLRVRVDLATVRLKPPSNLLLHLSCDRSTCQAVKPKVADIRVHGICQAVSKQMYRMQVSIFIRFFRTFHLRTSCVLWCLQRRPEEAPIQF